jgi:hypothetical protein
MNTVFNQADPLAPDPAAAAVCCRHARNHYAASVISAGEVRNHISAHTREMFITAAHGASR